MTTITKPFLAALRADIDAALVAVGEKHGVQLRTGKCKFSSDVATYQLDVSTFGGEGEVVTRELSDLRRFAPDFGITPEQLEQPLRVGRDTYTLVGFRNTGCKKPFLLKNHTNGILYQFTTELVLKLLGIKPGATAPSLTMEEPPPRPLPGAGA